MNSSQFLSILLARKWIALWVFLTTVIVTTLLSFLLPKTYTATTSLVINSKGSDPVTGFTLPAVLMPGYLATQVDIISSRNVALKVIDKLGIANNPTAKARFEKATDGKGSISDWYADQFLTNLEVEPSRESSVIKLHYQGSDPNFAAVLANAFAEAYIDTNLQLKVEPSRQAATWFDGQIIGLRQNVEKAQTKLSAYQNEHGIVSADERLDVETSRLAELSSQLVLAQSQTFDNRSRQNQLNRGAANESPEILSNPLIQGLKSQLIQVEAKFLDVSQRLDINHPQYQSAKSELDNIRSRISQEVARASSGVGQSTRVSQQRESEIRASLEAQKQRVLKLKNQHDEMSVLVREAENAERLYDTGLQRFGQTNLEGQSVQTDVSILNPAVAPLKHSSPKITLNILFSLLLGGTLGIGVALVAEMLDRRVRLIDDLVQHYELPVIGVIQSQKAKEVNAFKTFKQFFKKNRFKKKSGFAFK